MLKIDNAEIGDEGEENEDKEREVEKCVLQFDDLRIRIAGVNMPW